MTTTGYHLIDREALPDDFWQTTGDSLATIACLNILERSLRRTGACWLMWDRDRQALYEQRDLYQCRVVEHDVTESGAIPCGDLSRRCSLPIFFSVAQFWQILSRQPQEAPPSDEEIYCDVHAYDQDIPIPVINNWTSERIIDEGEQAAIVLGLT